MYSDINCVTKDVLYLSTEKMSLKYGRLGGNTESAYHNDPKFSSRQVSLLMVYTYF